jgi:outer membrane receptor protein involved in Fe transport
VTKGRRAAVRLDQGSTRVRDHAVLTLTALASAMALTYPAHAQQDDAALEEVLVTGSRIVRSGMQTPTPVTAVTSEELGRMEPGNMVDALSQLPQFLNNTNAQNRSNFLTPAGGAFLNVRGLGTDRTLVLLDGRRVPPSDRNSSVDTNLFPETLVERVEVVTGGASAAYGADALSGVVNFILNTRYDGFDAKIQGGQTKYNDGDNWEASFTGGMPVGDRMHVTFAVEGFRQDQVQGQIAGLDDRDWFGRWGYVTNPAFSAADPPGTNPLRLVLPDVHSTQFTPGGKINQPGFAFDQYTFIEDGDQLRPFVPGSVAVFDSGTLSTSGGPEFEVANLGERTILSSEVDRTNAFINFDFDVSEDTTVFVRGMSGQNYAYMNDVNGGLGPSLMGIWRATIFQDNAFLPDNVRQAMIDEGLNSFRMDKNGALVGRNNYQDDYRDGTEVIQRVVSAGFEHSLANDWTVTGFVQYGKSDKEAQLDNLLRVDRQFLAMDAVEVYTDRRDTNADGVPDLIAEADRGTGDIICNVQRYNPTDQQLAESVDHITVPSAAGPVGIAAPVGLDDSIENCVPLNIFGWGNVSDAAADYVVTDKSAKSEVEQKFAEFTVSGDVFEGWYAGELAFTAGATYREEEMSQIEYPREISVLGPPQNVDGTNPAQDNVDLGIRGIPPGFSGGSPNLHQFSTLQTFGGSFDVWEVFGETFVPLYTSDSSSRRVGLNLAARHSDYSRAGTIATWKVGLDAQLTESFRVRGTVSHDAREATFIEQFDLNGGGGNVDDPAMNGDTFSITVNSGGNPDLEPEEADTYTVGFVFQPSIAPGLAFSADYYEIDLSQTIGSLGTQRIVDDCFFDNVAQACALIDRDPVTNIITRVSNVLVNIDNAKVSGTDVELTYSAETDLFSNQSENLSFRFLAGNLSENSTTPLGGEPLDVSGSTSFPEWTTTSTVNYRVGPWSAYLQHRWVDSTTLNASWVEGIDVDDNTIDSINYTNLGLTYTRDSANGSWEVFGNVQNAFDENPPRIPANVGRSIPGSTGFNQHNVIALGRRYTIGARFRF